MFPVGRLFSLVVIAQGSRMKGEEKRRFVISELNGILLEHSKPVLNEHVLEFVEQLIDLLVVVAKRNIDMGAFTKKLTCFK
jgi:hypothetical protein